MFASTAALKGIEQYPKDDLESLFYTLIYLRNGSLPWVKFEKKDKVYYVGEILKMHTNLPKELLFKGFSEEVIFVYKTICNLKPGDKPDYEMYIKLLNFAKLKIIKAKKIKLFQFDWEIILTDINKKYKSLNVERKDLLKIAVLSKGYPIKIEGFLGLFNP
jgi:hypothetical protein